MYVLAFRSCSVAAALCLFLVLAADASFAQSASLSSDQIQKHLMQAQVDLSANETSQAVQEFQVVLSLDPANATALANLGALAYVRGDCRTAAADFQSALRTAPTLNKTQGLLAICMKRLGDPSALSLLKSSFDQLQDKSLRVQVGLQLAGSYYDRGEIGNTISTLGTLLDLSPDDPSVLFVSQRIYREIADDTLNKLAIIAPRSAYMEQTMAEHLINAGDVDHAIVHYRNALKIDPKLPGIHYEMGESMLQLSRSESSLASAESEFREAIQQDGDSAGVESQLGLIEFLRSRFDEAYRHYKLAVTLNPADIDAQMGIAKALMSLDRSQEALPYLRNVVEAEPMNTAARYRLVSVYKQLGQADEARRQLAFFRESMVVKKQVEVIYEQMDKPKTNVPGVAGDEPN